LQEGPGEVGATISPVPITERFGGFLRIGPDKTGVAVRQVHRKKVDLAFDPCDLCQSLAKIHLRMTGIVLQRPLLQPLRPHVVLNDGDPAGIAVLAAKPFEGAEGQRRISRPVVTDISTMMADASNILKRLPVSL